MSHYFVDDGWINDGLQGSSDLYCLLLAYFSPDIFKLNSFSNVKSNDNFTSNATVDTKDF